MLSTRRNKDFRIELSPERFALQTSRGLVGWRRKCLADTRRILVCSAFKKNPPARMFLAVGRVNAKSAKVPFGRTCEVADRLAHLPNMPIYPSDARTLTQFFRPC